ncbi:laminin subunit beta-2-like [Dendronephthya gigantea]|uniref:laminin subunit beta-2-like n=1 Tax=Dendronephthya gigantea TaxID=151771 RepID=UPI00106B240F|nr:laminin subunit beta-2-like [Dendronephthya gigantea]
MTCFIFKDFVFILKVFLLISCIKWHSRCSAAPCYDFLTKKPLPCFPQPVNAARGRNVTSSNTCGMPSAKYCEISPEKNCFICDANSSANMHPAEYMVDESSTWWQSDTWWDAIQKGITKIGQALHVNITVAFGKSYHVSGKIRVTFYSERPQAMIIERSNDSGTSWMPYQYFAEDCVSTYGMSPSESPPKENPLEVTCSEDYSGQFPSKNGIVEFQAYARYPPEDYMTPRIQSYMLSTHVRLRLEYPGTDGLELINSEVTLNRYYYAISDIRIDGRCNCHGHAEYCDGVGMDQYCFCEHNTMGRDCEHCRPLYNNQPWRPANTTDANECQKCNCNEHATSCIYNATIGRGHCINCKDNTTGAYCHACADGFYRDVEKPLNDSHVCIPCNCFPAGITDNGSCNQDMDRADVLLGQCNCKDNVFGRQCDECVPGYWGFRLPPGGHCQACSCNAFGTMNNSQTCDQQTGNCFCKSNIEGGKCSECKDGFYFFPTKRESDCQKCPCNVGGAYEICEKQTGHCNCRPNIEGEYCTVPKPGFFVPHFDYLLFEAEFQDENNNIHYKSPEQDQYTGKGFVLLSPDTSIQFTNIKVNVTWRYYLVMRYANSPQHSNSVFNITVMSNDLMSSEISSMKNQLRIDAKSFITRETFSLAANKLYNITVSLKSSGNGPVDGLLVDSLVLKPDLTPTRISEEINAIGNLSRCFFNATYLSSTSHTDTGCSGVVFSFSAEVYDGALACDCDPDGAKERSCKKIGGQCECFTGVSGRRCSYCLPGYYGFGEGDCKVCECDNAGSETSVCDFATGFCQCKLHTEGDGCSECKVGTFNLDARNQQGCQSCFGYGHGTRCSSAQGFVSANISTDFTGFSLGGWLITANSTGATAFPGRNGLSIRGNLTLLAPNIYLGLHLNSYRQKLSMTVSTSTFISAEEISLVLTGMGYDAELQPEIRDFGNGKELIFTLDESHLSTDDRVLSAFKFQSLLSNISSLALKIQSEMVVREIVLQSARFDPSIANEQIGFVENMTCFENYTGLSCEACATGFTRETANSGPFSRCVLCSCNGRSSQCHPETGVCVGCDIGSTGDHCEDCEFNVVGPYCNVCADGFYGLTQDHKNCKPCDCHLPGTIYGNTSSCNLTTGQCKCNQTLHTGGRRCNVCQENAWNRTESSLNCEECPSCFGMIKVEVDKFREQIINLGILLHSLLDMSILSQSVNFTEQLRITEYRVEETVTRSKVIKSTYSTKELT